MTKLSTRDSLAISQKLAKFSDFETHGALSGVNGRGTLGELPPKYIGQYSFAIYTIYSYNTPIAWYDNGWVIPKVKYSVTTSRHQSTIKRAIEKYTEI